MGLWGLALLFSLNDADLTWRACIVSRKSDVEFMHAHGVSKFVCHREAADDVFFDPGEIGWHFKYRR